MDLHQKKFSDLTAIRLGSGICLFIVICLILSCSAPFLFAQQAGAAAGAQGAANGEPEKESSPKGFWSLSDQELLRDELPTRPTPYEIEKIQNQVDQAFKNFLRLWAEEQYFELYKLGKQQSREYLSTEQFAVRMVQLDWVPEGLVEDQPFEISFRYRTFIYVDAGIKFRHKTKGELTFEKRQTFLLLWENGQWHFDLLQMLRSPFYTPLQPG
ncbi:MAG: hypothetical protein HQM13_03695 [SAR324 cluster bacterium]|nr:hypothetical protein [SAR324 cluster bacterium]